MLVHIQMRGASFVATLLEISHNSRAVGQKGTLAAHASSSGHYRNNDHLVGEMGLRRFLSGDGSYLGEVNARDTQNV